MRKIASFPLITVTLLVLGFALFPQAAESNQQATKTLPPPDIDYPMPAADATRMPQATLDAILKAAGSDPNRPRAEIDQVPTATATPTAMAVVPTLIPLPEPKRASVKCWFFWRCHRN